MKLKTIAVTAFIVLQTAAIGGLYLMNDGLVNENKEMASFIAEARKMYAELEPAMEELFTDFEECRLDLEVKDHMFEVLDKDHRRQNEQLAICKDMFGSE